MYTIPLHSIQLEAGFNVQQNDANNKEYYSPTLLSKYGINSRIELRLMTTVTTSSTIIIPQGTTHKTALEPIEIGAKIRLWEARKWVPKTSLLFHFAIPHTAGKANDINKIAPNFRFTFQNALTKKIAIGYNLGAEWDGESNTPAYVYTFASGLSISNRWYGYIEAFGEIKKGWPSQHSLDGGIAYNITNDCKADLSSGFGISPTAPSW